MILSSEQIAVIRAAVDASRIRTTALHDDVVDHLCCLVEEKMRSGDGFDQALCDALHELSPNGLDAIQRETDLLLNESTITMKTIIYSIGLATCISMTMGLMMKFLHMRGGEELINYGFLGFVLFFIPLLAISQFRSGRVSTSREKARMLFALISALVTGISVALKMSASLEWSSYMLMLGAGVFSFGFLPLHFYGMYKKATARA